MVLDTVPGTTLRQAIMAAIHIASPVAAAITLHPVASVVTVLLPAEVDQVAEDFRRADTVAALRAIPVAVADIRDASLCMTG